MAEALYDINLSQIVWEILTDGGPPTSRLHQGKVLSNAPVSCLTTDCNNLCGTGSWNQSAGLGLAEKLTAIEALSIRPNTPSQ